MCAYSHTFISPLLDYFRPKTNVQSQRYRVFVFMTVQVWILLKHHKKQPKSPKRARDVEKSLKEKQKKKSTHEKPVKMNYFSKAQESTRDT